MCDTPFAKQMPVSYKPKLNHFEIVEYPENYKGHIEYKVFEFPCGTCKPCRKRTKAEWAFRMEKEMQVSQQEHFVTLTYDDLNIPYHYEEKLACHITTPHPTLNYKDIQLFMKKLRRRHSKNQYTNQPLKYLVAGEYGEGSRPHWHLCIFNADEDDIARSWDRKGLIEISPLNSARVMYTLNYLDKKAKAPNDIVCKEMRHMSKGIGKAYDKYKNSHTELDLVALSNGQKLVLPRYYSRRWYPDITRQARAAKRILDFEKSKNRRILTLDGKKYDYFDREKTRKDANKLVQIATYKK